MSGTVLLTLLNDCLLAVALFVLFFYVARLSRQVQGILTWGAAHLAYTAGATLFDAGTALAEGAGLPQLALLCTHLGATFACAGMTGLGWSIMLFARRRPLRRPELLQMLAAVAVPLLTWACGGSWQAQSVAVGCFELLALAVMLWHLRSLDSDPYRLPARVMMGGCALLLLLYGSMVPRWTRQQFGFDEMWVGSDLSIWYLLNFCMLMLSSFRAAESLRQTALVDPLTSALNRRGLASQLERFGDGADARGLAVLALDLDHFKDINDRFGHQTGDMVLQRFADVVRACVRGDDLFARVGGEEFIVVARGVSAGEAQRLAERIRQEVQKLELSAIAPLRATVSLGVAASPQGGDLPALMRGADQALYEAKRQGRNRVEVDVADPLPR